LLDREQPRGDGGPSYLRATGQHQLNPAIGGLTRSRQVAVQDKPTRSRRVGRYEHGVEHREADYAEPRTMVLEATGGKGVDVAFEGAGGQRGNAAFETLKDGGWISAHGAP
jgi:NADPH-dependent curcumin reductase CurA